MSNGKKLYVCPIPGIRGVRCEDCEEQDPHEHGPLCDQTCARTAGMTGVRAEQSKCVEKMHPDDEIAKLNGEIRDLKALNSSLMRERDDLYVEVNMLRKKLAETITAPSTPEFVTREQFDLVLDALNRRSDEIEFNSKKTFSVVQQSLDRHRSAINAQHTRLEALEEKSTTDHVHWQFDADQKRLNIHDKRLSEIEKKIEADSKATPCESCYHMRDYRCQIGYDTSVKPCSNWRVKS